MKFSKGFGELVPMWWLIALEYNCAQRWVIILHVFDVPNYYSNRDAVHAAASIFPLPCLIVNPNFRLISSLLHWSWGRPLKIPWASGWSHRQTFSTTRAKYGLCGVEPCSRTNNASVQRNPSTLCVTRGCWREFRSLRSSFITSLWIHVLSGQRVFGPSSFVVNMYMQAEAREWGFLPIHFACRLCRRHELVLIQPNFCRSLSTCSLPRTKTISRWSKWSARATDEIMTFSWFIYTIQISSRPVRSLQSV